MIQWSDEQTRRRKPSRDTATPPLVAGAVILLMYACLVLAGIAQRYGL